MAIAPIEGNPPEQAAPGLRVIDGGRRPDAPPRGASVHARDGRAEDLRRSRAAHPTAATRVARASAPVADPAVLPVGAPWEDPSEQRPASAPRSVAVGRRDPASFRASMRARTLARRRRTVAIGVVITAIVLLAMPLRSLGAVTVDGQPTPAASPSGARAGIDLRRPRRRHAAVHRDADQRARRRSPPSSRSSPRRRLGGRSFRASTSHIPVRRPREGRV